MKATDLDRYGCTLGGKRITYRRLIARYACNECGGKICHSFVGGDRVFCGECGGDDFVSEYAYAQQVADGYEVLHSLPPQFRALYVDDEPKAPQLTAQQAIAELYN